VDQDIVALTRAGSANEVDIFGNSLTGYKTGIVRVGGRISIKQASMLSIVPPGARATM
jgi:hypothetical protein